MATAKKVVPIKSAPSASKPAKTGTAVAVKKPSSGAVVNIAEMLRAQAAAMSERTAPASGISIRVGQDKMLSLPDGSKADSLDLVVVDFVARNEFYEGKYDPKNIVPPICVAIGSNPLKLVPDDSSPNKQNDDCSSCPMNAFGSDGEGKACKNGRILAVLPADADEDTPIWLLKVSPTALKGFDGFVQNTARTFQMPPVGVIVTVSCDENKTYASLTFSNAVPNPNLNVHFARQEEARALLNTVPDMTAHAPAAAPAKAPARRATAGRR